MTCKWFSNEAIAQTIAVINSALSISALLYGAIKFDHPHLDGISKSSVDEMISDLIRQCHQIIAITFACIYLPFNIMLHVGIVWQTDFLVHPMMCLSFSTSVFMCPVSGIVAFLVIMSHSDDCIPGVIAGVVCFVVMVYTMYTWNLLCNLHQDFICQKRAPNHSERYNRVFSFKPAEDFELTEAIEH